MAQSIEARSQAPRLGAWVEGTSVRWRVWAPGHQGVDVVLYDAEDRVHALVARRPDAPAHRGTLHPRTQPGRLR
ncbi:MAG: hypothetical protein EOO72_16245, partial [Myxococcaceae bacterium]